MNFLNSRARLYPPVALAHSAMFAGCSTLRNISLALRGDVNALCVCVRIVYTCEYVRLSLPG